jgi:opacity protein-like surface antigen
MLCLKSVFSIGAALAALAAAPALAEGPYVGVSGGVALPQASKNAGTFTSTVPATAAFPAIPSGTTLDWRTKFDTGFNISALAGYRFPGGFRVEAELGYSQYGVKTHSGVTVGGTNIDALDVAVLTRAAPAAGNPTVGAVVGNGNFGRVKNLGGYANAYYDFNAGGNFQPYLGGGVGVQQVSVNYSPSNVKVGIGKKTVFAYQLMAGATYKISPGLELFGQYNYRAADRARIPLSLLPADLGVESKQSLISVGLRIPLGASAE